MSGNVITGLDNLFLRQDVLQSLTGDQKMLALYDAGLDIKGGVRLDGADSNTSQNGVWNPLWLGREFELTFKCRQTGFGAWRPVGSVATDVNAVGEWALNVGYPWQADGVAPSFGDAPAMVASNLWHGKWIDVAYGYDGTQWYIKLNGVRYNTRGEITPGLKPAFLRRMFGGIAGGYGQIAGDVAEIKLINKLDATPTDLVHKGWSQPQQAWTGCTYSAENSYNRFFVQHQATNWDIISAQPNAWQWYEAGQKVRLTCNITVHSGDPLMLPGFVIWNGQSFQSYTPTILQAGFNDVTLEIYGESRFMMLSFWHHPYVWGGNNANAVDYTISDITIDAIGTVAHYTPDSVGHDKTWADMVNGQDMILADSLRQFNATPRRPNCVVRKWDVNLHNVTIDGFGGEAWVGCDIRNTLKPRFNSSSIFTATSSTLPDGLTILDAKSDAGGFVTIRVMNNSGEAINTHVSGVPVVTLHHYIP